MRAARGKIGVEGVVGAGALGAVLDGRDVGALKGRHEGAEAWQRAGDDAVVHFDLRPDDGEGAGVGGVWRGDHFAEVEDAEAGGGDGAGIVVNEAVAMVGMDGDLRKPESKDEHDDELIFEGHLEGCDEVDGEAEQTQLGEDIEADYHLPTRGLDAG